MPTRAMTGDEVRRSLGARVGMAPGALLVCFALSFCIAVGGCNRDSAKGGAGEGGRVVVVVSGDTSGWITPCGCASNQSGGLLRRGTFVAGIAKSAEVVYVDVGGAPGGVSDYHREKFEAILRGEKLMGLAAHNLGKAELLLGAGYLREVKQRLSVPLVCANVTDEEGQRIGEEFRVITPKSGAKIGIIGVISPKLVPAPLKATDPRQAVLEVLSRNRAMLENAAILVLAYAPDEELSQLAVSLPEADAIVGGPTGQAIAPRRAGPVLLASATNKGKFLVQLEAAARGAAWQGQVVEMNSTFGDEPGQMANLKSMHAALAKADFAASTTGLVEPVPPSAPRDYRIAGSAACETCHKEDQQDWQKSAHFRAVQTLEKKGFQADPYCQSCHTTGFGLPGGFERFSSGREHFGVGCESCHGPSAAHVKDPKRKTTWAAADQCARCHDRENSPEFEYAAYWKRISHGKNPARTGKTP